jgi:sec-independent protein translocase protein TatB
MFGMGFGELAVVVIVALVIFGPKELPKVLRKLGQWAGKLRRMAADLRQQSGIDDALHAEGLTEPIREIQKLTRGELDGVMRAAKSPLTAAIAQATQPISHERAVSDAHSDPMPGGYLEPEVIPIFRDREVPPIGCDAYGALPESLLDYRETLPVSPLATDDLYAKGEEPKPALGPVVETKVA